MSHRLDLPPPYRFVRLREREDAFAHACAIAPETGAGTLVQVGRFDVVEFAIVLEPEEPLGGARRALFAGMNALADALGSHVPPETPVTFGWPGALFFDGALIGGGRLGWPADCPADRVPDWLVFGAMLRAVQRGDPGDTPRATSLAEEGGADDAALLESFSRHLMWGFDLWHERGFAALEALYLARLPKERAADERRIDSAGDLVVGNAALSHETRCAFPPLEPPFWLDPATGAPKLAL